MIMLISVLNCCSIVVLSVAKSIMKSFYTFPSKHSYIQEGFHISPHKSH